MTPFKLGFIGAGFLAHFQAKALTFVRDIELVGVHALKGAEELSALAKQYGIGDGTVYSSIAELCNHCDAVAVFVPNYVRVEIVEKIRDAVKAGAPLKGVICEKPLGRTVAEARRLVALVKEMGLPNVPYEYVPPMLVADVGANPWRYGNQGILLNSDGLKQALFGPIDGPPRNSTPMGMPG